MLLLSGKLQTLDFFIFFSNFQQSNAKSAIGKGIANYVVVGELKKRGW
jgi:hypothetical protein